MIPEVSVIHSRSASHDIMVSLTGENQKGPTAQVNLYMTIEQAEALAKSISEAVDTAKKAKRR